MVRKDKSLSPIGKKSCRNERKLQVEELDNGPLVKWAPEARPREVLESIKLEFV